MHRVLLLVLINTCCTSGLETPRINAKKFPVLSAERILLTRQYSLRHYGIDDWKLRDPKIIVVHYTAISTLKDTLRCFEPAVLSRERTDIWDYGLLNVGVHFVVDRNGDIYSLLPEDTMGRHAIGYNHVALGIENVGKNSSELTVDQIRSNALIISCLKRKYPGIRHLIGHHEYMNRQLPHFRYYRQADKSYRPSKKIDPGPEFMSALRRMLSEKYNLEFENGK